MKPHLAFDSSSSRSFMKCFSLSSFKLQALQRLAWDLGVCRRGSGFGLGSVRVSLAMSCPWNSIKVGTPLVEMLVVWHGFAIFCDFIWLHHFDPSFWAARLATAGPGIRSEISKSAKAEVKRWNSSAVIHQLQLLCNILQPLLSTKFYKGGWTLLTFSQTSFLAVIVQCARCI